MSDRKSRRSSILKPPKQRNPLSDLKDTSRRVSFANVHLKKEFTADPEKNTIWHTSYEEELKTASNISAELEFTESVPGCLQINILDQSVIHQDPEDMDFTQIISKDVSRDEIMENDLMLTNISLCNSSNTSDNLEDSNMEITEMVVKVIEEVIPVCSIINLDESSTEVDSIIPVDPEDWSFNLEEELAKLPSIYSIIDGEKILISTELHTKKKYKLNLAADEFASNINFETPEFEKYFSGINFSAIESEITRIENAFKRAREFRDKIEKLTNERKEKTVQCKTLLDKILEMKNKDTLWNLIPNTKYSFTYMNNIQFDVQLETDTEIVENVDITFNDESQLSPIGCYCYQNEKLKLTTAKIKAAIGEKYTIFSLLDYISKVGEETMEILEEYDHLTLDVGMKLDRNLNAILLVSNTYLRIVCEIVFNLNNLNNINADSISVKHLVQSVDEKAIKRLIKFCPPGFSFIREFDRLIKDYLKQLVQKNKEFISCR